MRTSGTHCSKTAGQVFVERNFLQGLLSVMIYALPEDDNVDSIDVVEFVGNAESWCHHVARDQRRPRGTEVRLACVHALLLVEVVSSFSCM